jgi:hypothetical protein
MQFVLNLFDYYMIQVAPTRKNLIRRVMEETESRKHPWTWELHNNMNNHNHDLWKRIKIFRKEWLCKVQNLSKGYASKWNRAMKANSCKLEIPELL